MNVLETPRLWLKPLAWEDLDALAAVYADPEVMRFFTGSGFSRSETEQALRRILESSELHGVGFWGLYDKQDNAFIGRGGLMVQDVDGNLEMEIGYLLAKAYWGKGLATEVARFSRAYAFGELGLHRVISIIHPENFASQRVAAKTGLTYERDIFKWNTILRVYSLSHPSKSLPEIDPVP